MPLPSQPFHKIEDVKRKLYERDFLKKVHSRQGVLHPISHEVPSKWVSNDTSMKKVRTSFSKKFFIGAIIFFIGCIAFGAYMYFRGTTTVSNDNINISVLGNSFTEGGQVLPLQIEIVNKNNSALELADMIVQYPRGASSNTADSNTNNTSTTPNTTSSTTPVSTTSDANLIRLPRESLGTIVAGGSVERNENVTLYGDQGTVRDVTVILEYHPAGSNAIFTKQIDYPVTISSSPLSLDFSGPAEVSSNQEASFTITAVLNTSLPSDATMLQVQYPTGFTFESALPAPSLGQSMWSLSNLAVGKPLVITLKGSMAGQDGDQQNFHVYVGKPSPDSQSISTVYNSLLYNVSLAKPFLDTQILVNNQNSAQYSVAAGVPVHAQVLWSNNLPTEVTDAQIAVTLSGNAYDKTAVVPTNGFFDSNKNQIVWDKNSDQALATVQPGDNGTLDFTFTPISSFGTNQSISSPEVVVDVSIAGSQPSTTGQSSVTNSEEKVIKIASAFQIVANASFKSGALPPVAGSPTTYTITWTLSNSTNAITQAEAQATLPSYITWTGNDTSNENVTYNSSTRTVTWAIGSVTPYTGFGAVNREASFDVTLTPSTSQVGSVPQLIQSVLLSGQDSFANTLLTSNKNALTTSLSNDPHFKPGDEVVTQ